MSSTTISDSDLDKEMVYLAYRDVFKNGLAKMRKRGKVRSVVEKHKDHPTGTILQVGKTVPKEAFLEDKEKSQKVLKRKRDCDISPTNPTYLPSRLQHLILTQTQRLLEECCYNFAKKWFPSMLEANAWDAPEAAELNRWWKALSKCDIPLIAIKLSPGQSLAVPFRHAIYIRHCAVHRRPQIPVNKVKEMIRDAWLLSQALQDNLRATRLLSWYKELESLVEHLELRTNSQREAAEAELRNIQNSRLKQRRGSLN